MAYNRQNSQRRMPPQGGLSGLSMAPGMSRRNAPNVPSPMEDVPPSPTPYGPQDGYEDLPRDRLSIDPGYVPDAPPSPFEDGSMGGLFGNGPQRSPDPFYPVEYEPQPRRPRRRRRNRPMMFDRFRRGGLFGSRRPGRSGRRSRREFFESNPARDDLSLYEL